MAENKKTLTVTQQVKELIYDIQNKAYLTGQAREAEGKRHTKLPRTCKQVMMMRTATNPPFLGQRFLGFEKSARRVSVGRQNHER